MLEFVWQDMVLMIGNFIFFLALIPSIVGKHKPSKWTSFLTACTLTIFSYTYHTLALTYATITVTATAFAWWVLFFQKCRN